MSLIAEFEIHCEQLPLVSVAAAVPTATLHLELQFAHGPQPLFLLTVIDGRREPIDAALTAADDVATYTHIGEAGDTQRYQAVPAYSLDEQLGGALDDLAELKTLAQTETIIDRIKVMSTGWTQTGWFAHREAFDAFRRFWQRQSEFRLRRLTRNNAPEPAGEGLTDNQREALRTAYELGYFEIPRGASLEEVATELGISASSVSERLRRGQTQLIEETVATMWPPLSESADHT